MHDQVNVSVRACAVTTSVRTRPAEQYYNYQWIFFFGGRGVSTSF